MQLILLVIHILVAMALIGVVLMQRSEGGALGIGGAGGGLMSGRSAANLLTRATAVLAVAFFAISIALGLLASRDSGRDLLAEPPPSQAAPPIQGTGDGPAVPLSQ